MAKTPECTNFEEVINKIINKGNVPPEELNVLLDNPLAFADFMSNYYNKCLKKSSNKKNLFSMTTLNNDNIKILMSMDEGFNYIDDLSNIFKELLPDVDKLKDIITGKKIGENQAIIIIKGLKKMFKTDSSSPIDIKIKKEIDNLLQTFMKRDSYNKVVENPNKDKFQRYIIKEFGVNIHAYYNGMSLLHLLKDVKGKAQKLESPEETFKEKGINTEKETKINKEDEELLLTLLNYSEYFQQQKNKDLDNLMRKLETVGGGNFNLKTKKKRLKNQKQNINKKKTHKKGGGNSDQETKINKILNETEFKEFFKQNIGLREYLDKLDINRKILLIFHIFTRIAEKKKTLSDENPDNIPSDENLNFELFYDQNNVVNNSQFVTVSLEDLKKSLNEKIEDNNNKDQLVESLSNYINSLNEQNEQEKLEKKFWYYILSIESNNILDLKYPDWEKLNEISSIENKNLNKLIESLKNE